MTEDENTDWLSPLAFNNDPDFNHDGHTGLVSSNTSPTSPPLIPSMTRPSTGGPAINSPGNEEGEVMTDQPCPAISSWTSQIVQDANMYTVRFSTPDNSRLSWVDVHWAKGTAGDRSTANGSWEHNLRMQRLSINSQPKWISTMYDSNDPPMTGEYEYYYITYSSGGVDCNTAILTERIPA